MTSVRLKYNYRKDNIIIFWLLFPHMRPESLAYIAPQINIMYNIGRIVSFAILILLSIYKRTKPSLIMFIVLIMQMWVVFTTYLNHGDIQRAFIMMMSTLSLMLIVDIYSKKRIIEPLLLNFEWLIYVNLATVVLFPNGLYRRGVHKEFVDFFLGFKNSFFPYCIVAIFLSGLFYLKNKKSRIRSSMLMIASFLNVLLTWSASSVVAILIVVLMFVFTIVVQKPKILRQIKFHTLIFAYIVIDLMVCVFNIVENTPFIAHFVTNVLHKLTTLSGRTIIWGMALQFIRKKPITGYGIGEHIYWRGYNWYGHNQIFEMLMEGGIPCLVLYIFIIGLIAIKMKQCNNMLVYNMLVSVFSGLFVYFITEAGVSPIMYLLFSIAFHINEIGKAYSIQDKRRGGQRQNEIVEKVYS